MKAVVLLSGGLDSTVCLFWARSQFTEVVAVGFDYMQRNGPKECRAAREVADMAGVPYEIIRCVDVFRGVADSRFTHLGDPIKTAQESVVDGRNTIFLALASIYAKRHEAKALVIGVTAEDQAEYIDCRRSYLEALATALELGVNPAQRIYSPLISLSKRDVILLGRSLKAGRAMASSWSCYEFAETPCGRCPACVVRARGFEGAGDE